MINKIAMIVGAVAIFFAGMFTNYKLTKTPILNCPEINIPKCPECPPQVTLQQLDMTSIKKIKGDFTYSPQFHGTVILETQKDTIKK